MRITISCCRCLFVYVISLSSLYGNTSLEAADKVSVTHKLICINPHIDKTVEIILNKFFDPKMFSEKTLYYGLKQTGLKNGRTCISRSYNQFVSLFQYHSYLNNTESIGIQKVHTNYEYKELLNLTTVGQQSPQKPKTNKSKSIDPSTADESKTYYLILVGFLLGTIIGALGVYLYSRNKIYSILDTDKDKYLNDLRQNPKLRSLQKRSFNYIGVVAVLKQSINQKKEELRKFKKLQTNNRGKYTDIPEEQRVDQLDYRYDINKTKDEFYNARIEEIKEIPGIQEFTQELFFSMPDSDGGFKEANAQNNRRVDSLYKIVVDKTGQRGSLNYLSGDYDSRALDNIEYYLNPVCEIVNITNRLNAIRIQMIDEGAVIRIGDTWRIENNKKVIVKLI